MKAYRMIWDEENHKFTYGIFEIKHDRDFDSIPDTNLYDTDNGFNLDKESVVRSVEDDNKRLETGEWKVIKCKDCGKYFILPQEEINWFKDRGLYSPKRCNRCRSKRKSNNGGTN